MFSTSGESESRAVEALTGPLLRLRGACKGERSAPVTVDGETSSRSIGCRPEKDMHRNWVPQGCPSCLTLRQVTLKVSSLHLVYLSSTSPKGDCCTHTALLSQQIKIRVVQ